MDYTKHISIDVNAQDSITAIYAKQGDVDSRYINVRLTDNGQAVSPPSTAFAILRCRKPDGHATLNTGTIEDDGTITFPLSEQTIILPGEVQADISISDSGTVLSSTVFRLIVIPAPDIADQTTSSSEFTALTDAISHIRSATIDVGTVTKGDNASVTNVGTDTDAIFDFVLPKGDAGPIGEQGNGISSVTLTDGTHAPGTLDTYTITYDNGNTSTFQVYNGADGELSSVVPISLGGTGATSAAGATDALLYRGIATDLNATLDTGIYGTSESTQNSKVWGTCVVIRRDTQRIIQINMQHNRAYVYMRTSNDGGSTWEEWRNVYTSACVHYSTSEPWGDKGFIWLKPIE